MKIERSNQVWAIDITYIQMKRGFMYLFAIIDLLFRYVVGREISNSMTSEWCVSVLEEAIGRYDKPEIFNSEQGCQFTADKYIGFLKTNEIQVSMDGKRRAVDNAFIERLWRRVKQEFVYLNPCDTVNDLWHGLCNYFQFYNTKRPHQNLGYLTPAEC